MVTAQMEKRIVHTEESEDKLKRYQLVLPSSLYARVQREAEVRGTTVVGLLRTFIKLGLMVVEAEKQPGTELILRTKDTEKQLVLV